MAILLDDDVVRALVHQPSGGRRELSDRLAPGLRLRIGRGRGRWSLLYRDAARQRVRRALGDWPVMSVDQARQAAAAVLRGSELDELILWHLMEQYWTAKLGLRLQGQAMQRSVLAVFYSLLERDVCTLRGDELRPLFIEMFERAPTHARRTLAYARAMFSWAVSTGLMNASPLAEVRLIAP